MKEKEYIENMHRYFNAVLRMRRDLRQKVQKILVEHGHSDITLEMTQVLYFLRFFSTNGKSNQQEIADRTGKNKSSVTSLLDNMVKRGLVKRIMDSNDRRSNIITPTAEGLAFVGEVYDKVYKAYDLSKVDVSMEELQKMTTLMENLMES